MFQHFVAAGLALAILPVVPQEQQYKHQDQ